MMPSKQETISYASVIEADLQTSWNIGSGPFYWYRVEGECGSVECERMGVGYEGCQRMTIVTTVSAQNLDELCFTLANPRVNAPFVSKIKSIRRYSRPVLKANPPSDLCNVLEEVQFCQIPDCFDFCPDDHVSFLELADIRPRFLPHYQEDNKIDPPVILGHGAEPQSFSTLSESGTYTWESTGSIQLGGFAYCASPSGDFQGSGGVEFSGGIILVNISIASGSVGFSGEAECNLNLSHTPSGSLLFSGVFDYVSPSYSYTGVGSVFFGGSPQTSFVNLGTFVVSSEVQTSAFGFGYDYIESTSNFVLSISDFTVSACGCSQMAPTLSLRHNLLSSKNFSDFLSSGGLTYSSTNTLRYKSSELSWSSTDCLVGRNSSWEVSMSLGCKDNSWGLLLGVADGKRATKIILDIPADVLCGDGFIVASILAYFSPYSSDGGSNVKIQAVSPPKKIRRAISGSVEAYVNEIFIPQTVYYDEIGLFGDSYWQTGPLRIDINPIARNDSTIMDLRWVV